MHLPFRCALADTFLLCAISTAVTLKTLNGVCVCLNICRGPRNYIVVFGHPIGHCLCFFSRIARVTLGEYDVMSAHNRYPSL